MKPQRVERIDNVISGRAQDFPARLTRSGLRTLEPVYRTITRWRNRSYDSREGRVTRVGRPVISIGNLTTGGTGKTPLVRWVTEQLLGLGETPAIVSRGYGSKPGIPNDEYRELELFLPTTPHVQNPDRVIAARAAIEEHAATCIVLDDGFQHRRIFRDLDIVLIDATRPFGYNHLLPRGLLREPVESLARATAVILTRCDQVQRARLEQIRKRIGSHVDATRIAEVLFEIAGEVDLHGKTANPVSRAGVLAFCGIGNPSGFQHALQHQGQKVVKTITYPDHHAFTQQDLDHLHEQAQKHDAAALLCTVKDLVKVKALIPGPLPLFAVSIQTRFLNGEAMIRDLISESLRLTASSTIEH